MKNPAAVALGSIKSAKKAASSAANGAKGGRPSKFELQTLTPDACGYCAFVAAGLTEADARSDGWDWASRPTKCTCAPVVRVRARVYQHIYNEAHVVLTPRQHKRLVPGFVYRWGQYHARVIPEIG